MAHSRSCRFPRSPFVAAYKEINETPGVTPGNGLRPPETATTVRVQDGRTITTDGPFVETKEALNGLADRLADVLAVVYLIFNEGLRRPRRPGGGSAVARTLAGHADAG